MHIIVLFHFNHEQKPAAITGIEGEVTNIILPSVGDDVDYSDSSGVPFSGRITARSFKYDLPQASHDGGVVAVTLHLDRRVADE